MRSPVLAMATLAIVLGAPAFSQPVTLGPPYRAVGDAPVLASNAAGEFMTVWFGRVGRFGQGINAQGFDRNGNPFRVHWPVAGGPWYDVKNQDVAAGFDDSFVIAWTTYEAESARIEARFYSVDGTPRSELLLAAESPSGQLGTPAVAWSSLSAETMLVWPSTEEEEAWGVELQGRILDRQGQPIGPVFPVNHVRRHEQSYPSVAPLKDGGFVVVWEERREGSGGVALLVRLFDREGRPRGIEQQLHESPVFGHQTRPVVSSSLRTGRFAVSWQAPAGRGLGYGAFVRLFDVNGRPLSGDISISSRPSSIPTVPTVSMGLGGDFAVVWIQSPESGGGREIRTRWFDWQGSPVGGDVEVVRDSQVSLPDVGMDEFGNFVVIWKGSSGNQIRRFAAPCVFGPTAELASGRFQAESCWRGTGGPAGLLPLTEPSTAFWFFEDGLPDQAVKVLDGRAVNGYFWVFGTSLSTFQSLVRVTDTATGAVRLYLSRPGEMASFADTKAFSPGPPVSTAAAAAAPPSATLSLLNDRFEVQAAWRDALGRLVPAAAVSLSSQAGYFWFFGPENPELIVKILDGRPLTDSAWLFFGGMSHVEYTVTVTHRPTGQTKTYLKPAGSFRSQLDTASFPP